jgi:uncharacterized protein (DUF885 family)
MHSAEPLPRFVDEYLSWLHETHPTSATFDGVHAFDDLLEDLSRSAIESQVRELGSFARRLAAIDPDRLAPAERIDHPLAEANIRARLYELEQVRTWERDPHFYAELLSTSLASQALFSYAPAEERARRVMSKLRQIPRLLQSARDNIKDPPGIFVKIGLETLRGTLRFVEDDLPRAFTEVDDLHVLGDLADASTEASHALRAYVEDLERELGPRSRGSFRLGRERFEEKLRLEEGVTLSSEKLLEIVMRELRATQELFRREVGRLDGGDPVGVWQRLKAAHPGPGEIVAAAQEQVDELRAFIDRHGLVTVPEAGQVIVAETPRFYRWTSASMWTPGPFEHRPLQAYYYVTDVDRAWPQARQEEHLRDFNFGALWSISMHEVYPGHFLHYQHLRRIPSPLRKSILFASASFVEGWAHYAEQLMIEAGFRRTDPSVRLGQIAESLIRLCRAVVSIRLHTEDLSVEQGVRVFREEAFLEEASARREAERGAFDPSYLVYSLGKLMLIKLREDARAAAGARFSLREFHDALLANGHMPFNLHRRQLLGEDAGKALE